MLNALVARSGHGPELLRYLPAALAEEIQGLALSGSIDIADLISHAGWSEKIHYSWFSELFKKFPLEVQNLCLSILSPHQREGLLQMLQISFSYQQSSPFVHLFVNNFIRKQFLEEDILDEAFLPPSLLNVLLKCTRPKLIHIIDFLGIHDLSTDLRQIVDKVLLGKVYHVLTRQQLHFLHYCSKQPLKWISPKLGLLAWDGSKKQLNHLLHHRGLIRLARAINQENASYKWHLLHRLDTGRAKVIQNEFFKKQDPVLLPYFKNQVLHIAGRLQ